MSEQLPERADMRQLRTQAKELLRSLQNGETVVETLSPATVKLSDAQFLIAKKYGFDSWPKLVDQVELPALLDEFRQLVDLGDAAGLDKLLRSKASVRKRINDPMFSFEAPAIVAASHRPNAKETLPILVRYGADPNARSRWWAGSFGALDHAQGEAVDVLLSLGTKFDVWSAAAHGRLDVLRSLLDADPTSVNAPGGDGATPLHFAKNAEVAAMLIARGANVEQKDIDHEGTPIQHHVQEPKILRLLLEHGAKPDIFTAIALNDPKLLREILAADPSAMNARVGHGEFVTRKSDGGHIYTYKIGPMMTPHMLAAKMGLKELSDILLAEAGATRRLVAAAWMGDEASVDAILAEHPRIGSEMGGDARSITDAAQEGRTETVRLLLKAGVDPSTPGMDSGSALHVACWFGYIDVVRLLADRVPLDLTDSHHKSPPLGWAAHGSNWCRNKDGDYVAVVEALIAAGADVNAPANLHKVSMLTQAGSREDVKAVLREHGAK